MNWDAMFKLAAHHRIFPAVQNTLQHRGDLPPKVRSALNSQSVAHARRVLRFLAELSSILQTFSEWGIEVVAHKGPALGQRLYGDPAMREFGDLDFLVRPADVPRAREALKQLGLKCRLKLAPRQEQEYLRTGYEYVFGSSAERNLVELQWQIVPRFYSVAFQIDDLFRRSRELKIDGRIVRVLGDEDLMLALCVHAAKHCWEQLGMIRDISTLTKLPMNWRWIADEAKRLGIVRVLLVSLLLGKNLLGVDLPQELAGNQQQEASESVARVIEDRLRRGNVSDGKSADYFRFFMSLRERRQERFRLAFRLALTPSVGEWQAIRLPDELYPLYYGVRALRLLKRAF